VIIIINATTQALVIFWQKANFDYGIYEAFLSKFRRTITDSKRK